MHIGGVLLAAGMELAIAAGDQLDGTVTIRFIIHAVAGTRVTEDGSWLLLDGVQRASATALTVWTPRRVCVRVEALKRCLVLPAA